MAITISGENNNDRILASDGVLDSISGINAAGIVTATSFTGDLTGDVTGNLTGNVNATSNLLLQIGGSEKFRVASSGQLGIGGANYGTSGQVLTSGGSGSAATWSAIPSQVTINNASGNRVITSDGGTTLNGEANLTYNGSNLALTGNDNQYITIGASADLTLKADGSNSAIVHNGDGDLAILAQGTDENIKLQSAGYTHFLTGGGNERLRIFSNGSVGVGDFSSASLTHAFQALRTSGSTYVSSKNTGGSAVFYAEASNGNTAKLELMQSGIGNFTLEVGSTNALMFKDDGTERLRITSAGNLKMPDAAEIQLGNDTQTATGDLRLFHNGSNSGIINSQGALYIQNTATNSSDLHLQGKSSIQMHCPSDGNVKLSIDSSGISGDIKNNYALVAFVSDRDDGTRTTGSTSYQDDTGLSLSNAITYRHGDIFFVEALCPTGIALQSTDTANYEGVNVRIKLTPSSGTTRYSNDTKGWYRDDGRATKETMPLTVTHYHLQGSDTSSFNDNVQISFQVQYKRSGGAGNYGALGLSVWAGERTLKVWQYRKAL